MIKRSLDGQIIDISSLDEELSTLAAAGRVVRHVELLKIDEVSTPSDSDSLDEETPRAVNITADHASRLIWLHGPTPPTDCRLRLARPAAPRRSLRA
jgi:hypothetical protein